MNKLELININGNKIEIDLSNENIKKHFDNPQNYSVHILNQINNGGCDILKRFIPEGATCLDIGANIGLVSLWMAQKCKIVHAWEPNKSNYEILQELIKYHTNIFPFKRALHNKNEFVKFYECDFNSTMNSLIDFSQKNNYESVEGVTLSKYVASFEKIDFVKIDIEGSEVIALNEEILSNCKGKIKSYYLECHNSFEIDGRNQFDNLDIFTNIFKNLGYTVERVTHQVDNATIICY